MPLANGILAGRYNDSIPEDSRAKLKTHPYFLHQITSAEGQHKIAIAKKLEHLAKEKNRTLAQLVLSWCLYHQHIHSVILGISKKSQLQENIATLAWLESHSFHADLIATID